jgi:phosphoribosylaminoimidazole-succinocarboxamide synthase
MSLRQPVDPKKIEPYIHHVLSSAVYPDLPNPYHGKVRDNYDLPDGRRVLVATDRLSAFDQILTTIPLKGQVLTQIARFWFDATKGICPNYVLSYPDPNVVIGKKLRMLPVEVIVRGYLAGTTGTSILTMYHEGHRDMYGIHFPDGMRDNEKLPRAIITPTTKAMEGSHDMPLSPKDIVSRNLLTKEQMDEVFEKAMALFEFGTAQAAKNGLILADTKYEFGFDEDGQIILADEIHTPDSSRYWFEHSYAERFEAGKKPESFDKDVIRNWVVSQCDPYKDPIPPILNETRIKTAAVYIDAFETITGKSFEWPTNDVEPYERIKAAVKKVVG